MLQNMFLAMLSYMPWVSCAIVLLFILRKAFPAKFSPRLYRAAYILLGLRIALPFNFSFKSAPIALEIPMTLPIISSSDTAKYASQSDITVAHTSFIEHLDIFLILAIIWIAVAALYFTYILTTHILFTIKLCHTRQKLCSGYIHNKTDQKIKLYKSSLVPSPILLGFIRPVLYVPNDACNAEDAQMIVQHELYHKQNGDLWVKLLLSAARSIAWFNPLVYLMVNDAQFCIEMACDEAVLRGKSSKERHSYGEMLLASYTSCAKNQYLCAPFSRGGKDAKRRFSALFEFGTKKRGTAIFALLLCFTLIASTCISCTAKPSSMPEIAPPANHDIGLPQELSVNSSFTSAESDNLLPQKNILQDDATVSSKQAADAADSHSASFDFDASNAQGNIIMQNPLPEGKIISRKFSTTHEGVDIAAPADTVIYSAADGEILKCECDYIYGNSVVIDHGKGIITKYAHAKTIEVKSGDIVKAGDVIATVGSTGNSTGNHLHFEISVNGEFSDPCAYISFPQADVATSN